MRLLLFCFKVYTVLHHTYLFQRYDHTILLLVCFFCFFFGTESIKTYRNILTAMIVLLVALGINLEVNLFAYSDKEILEIKNTVKNALIGSLFVFVAVILLVHIWANRLWKTLMTKLESGQITNTPECIYYKLKITYKYLFAWCLFQLTITLLMRKIYFFLIFVFDHLS